jgi:hypothetical protein
LFAETHLAVVLQALAQDQLRTLVEMKKAFRADINVNIYNGDTPREDRLWIRDNARLVNRWSWAYRVVLNLINLFSMSDHLLRSFSVNYQPRYAACVSLAVSWSISKDFVKSEVDK